MQANDEQEVINDLLGYTNLKIVQNKKYFNFSLDSIILPNFVRISSKKLKIIDLGTGNAPIPLILSEKTNSEIIAVELQNEIYNLAKKTIQLNDKDQQIKLLHEDIKNLNKVFKSGEFDIVISNPPYFKINDKTLRNKEIVKTNARHEILISLDELIKIGSYLLKDKGSLYLIHRVERLSEIVDTLIKNNLEPKRLRIIYPYVNKEANMFLIEAVKHAKPGLIIEKPLIVHDEAHNYTKEIEEMFKR